MADVLTTRTLDKTVVPNTSAPKKLVKAVRKIDIEGNFIADILVEYNEGETPVIPSDCVDADVPRDKLFQKPKWDSVNKVWIEGLPTQALDHAKAEKKKEMNSKCQESIEGGFLSSSLGAKIGMFPYQQNNLNATASDFTVDNTITSTKIKTEDKGVLTLNKSQFVTLFRESQAHKQSQLDKYESKKIDIKNATTIDAVNLIVW